MLIPCDEINILNTFRVMIILRLLLLLTNLHLKLLSTQGTGADKLLSTQRVTNQLVINCNDSELTLSSFNSKSQIDVAILDFSKAFDTVPHAGLLGKLKNYGIDSKILLWITNFLNNRKQRVVVDGSFSNFVDVESSVPQGTDLGPLLFFTSH